MDHVDEPVEQPAGPSPEAATTGADDPDSRRFRLTRTGKIVVGVLAVILLLAGAAGVWLVRQINPPGPPGEAVAIEITEGSAKSAIADLLDDRDVITSSRVFRIYMRVTRAGEFQAGIYKNGELRTNMAMGDVVDALESGPEIAYERLTVPEGLTVDEIAERVGALEGRSAEPFLELATSGTAIRSSLQPEGVETLEGLLFPDTYLIAEDEDEEDILRRMVTLFEQVSDSIGITERAEAVGLTPYEAVILASLVEAEAKVPEDRELIASVIHNRLADGMLLQVDATVIYALGEHTERVLFRDLEIESPYNTYRNPGLPPTPIAASGEASLEAAVAPADTEFRFYVKTDESGKHAFARTAQEHQRNVADARERGVI